MFVKLLLIQGIALVVSIISALFIGYFSWLLISSPSIKIVSHFTSAAGFFQILAWTFGVTFPLVASVGSANWVYRRVLGLAGLELDSSKSEKYRQSSVAAILASIILFIIPWVIALCMKWKNYDGYCYYGFVDGGKYRCSFLAATYNVMFPFQIIWIFLPLTIISAVTNYFRYRRTK